jgi:chromosome segregation ATPase
MESGRMELRMRKVKTELSAMHPKLEMLKTQCEDAVGKVTTTELEHLGQQLSEVVERIEVIERADFSARLKLNHIAEIACEVDSWI